MAKQTPARLSASQAESFVAVLFKGAYVQRTSNGGSPQYRITAEGRKYVCPEDWQQLNQVIRDAVSWDHVVRNGDAVIADTGKTLEAKQVLEEGDVIAVLAATRRVIVDTSRGVVSLRFDKVYLTGKPAGKSPSAANAKT